MNAEIDKKIQESISALMEHCDTVRIFVTVHNGANDTTRSVSRGAGNFYAQRGAIIEWCAMQDEIERDKVRKQETDNE